MTTGLALVTEGLFSLIFSTPHPVDPPLAPPPPLLPSSPLLLPSPPHPLLPTLASPLLPSPPSSPHPPRPLLPFPFPALPNPPHSPLPTQLGVCDDCGFSPFCDDISTSREVAFAKMKARIDGTRKASRLLLKKQ